MPIETIPAIPHHEKYPTPSGWQPLRAALLRGKASRPLVPSLLGAPEGSAQRADDRLRLCGAGHRQKYRWRRFRSPLRSRPNDDASSISTSKQTPAGATKRRRIVVSSDEEDNQENEAKKVKNEPTTPKTPKTAAKKTDMSVDMAQSFIHSFKFDDSMNSSMDESMNPTADFEGERKSKNAEGDKYEHEKLEWLKPDKIKDSAQRKPSHADYDPTTLFVPSDFIKGKTPGHQQWWQIKSANFDTVLLFKVGKFYEVYHMDATVAVTCLGLSYMKGEYAHAGFPEAAYGKFADQLVSRGYKVARVEQTETPQQLEERNAKKTGPKEKVVRRELCRITTAATKTYGVLEGDGEAEAVESATKYLFALKEEVVNGRSVYGVCFIDTSLGAFNICQFDDDDYRSFLRTLLAKYCPTQLLLERGHISSATAAILNTMLTTVPKEYLTPRKQFLTADATVAQIAKPHLLGLDNWPQSLQSLLNPDSTVPKAAKEAELAWSSIGAVLSYLERCLIDVDMVTMRNFVLLDTSLVSKPCQLTGDDYWKDRQLILDGVTIFNLNLIPSDDGQASAVSLYTVVNHCITPFGRRLLRQWICSPSCDPATVQQRQLAVEFLYSAAASTPDLKNMTAILKELPDLERLMQKIHVTGLKYRAETHPDSRAQMFEAAKYNGRKIRNLAIAVEGFGECLKLFRMETRLQELHESGQFPGSYEFIISLFCDLLAEELETTLTTFQRSVDLKAALETGKVEPNPGVDADYDEAAERVENCLEALEAYRKEQENLLKCSTTFWGTGKNRYQLEVPESKKVPSSWVLKSQTKNSRRYHTPELSELIDELAAAELHKERQAAESARKVFEQFDNKRPLWTQIVDRIATLDVIFSFVKYAQTSTTEVCRPEFDFAATKPFISIENGSHPCLSAQVAAGTSYIANDSVLGAERPATMLLTGPNMGGKSTLMRQVAVLTVMAHMGALVPAKSMKLSPVDRIFTRIGANDRIMCGQSTFFVEMNETKIIMRDATVHSLVLVDELGRGTSTFDGTAIAAAVLDEFANRIGCRTFFSTHYHSLCTAAQRNRNIFQAHMACMVENENEQDPTEECVTFLYKLADGPCPKSYGFFAAKLAGVRDEVVRHAYSASTRIVREGGLEEETAKQLREAAAGGASDEDLRRMVDAL